MFIEKEELYNTVSEYTLGQLQATDEGIRLAILAAIDEATSYLNTKYDCTAIFSAVGDNRNILVLEHCKSLAVWYIIRKSNADIIFEKAKLYYDSAVDWFGKVAGVGTSGKTIAPNLPVKRSDGGEVKIQLRCGSNPKFSHHF